MTPVIISNEIEYREIPGDEYSRIYFKPIVDYPASDEQPELVLENDCRIKTTQNSKTSPQSQFSKKNLMVYTFSSRRYIKINHLGHSIFV